MTAETRVAALQAELQRFVDIVAADPHTHQIILFGSVASGTPHEWSDLDIVVVMETSRRFIERMGDVKERVRSNLAMDVLVYTPDEWAELKHTRPFIRDEIVAKGSVLYDRSRTALD